MAYRQIEVYFPAEVEISNEDCQALVGVVDRICQRYRETHPARIMWPFGIGDRPTFIPMTAEEEKARGMEFDASVFQIECSEREDYDWKCARCGRPQGDHKGLIVNPPAGDCEFLANNA